MLYSSAVVLSTLAIGSAAASNQHNRHASFHARRQADAKRSADSAVNWDSVAYDLKDVDWSKVNWSSVFASSTPAAVVAAAATTSAVVQVQAVSTKTTASSTAKATTAVAATSTKAASTKTSAAATSTATSDTLGSVVSELLDGVEAIASKIGCKTGTNSKKSNGGIWVGDDSAWQASFTNDGNDAAVLYCWKADGYSGMIISQNTPAISVGLKSGESVTLSFAADVPAACAPAFSGTTLSNFGGLNQTWWEVTFGAYGAFDVSRNVNMNGNTIHSKGSKCTSNMDTCVFKCKDSSLAYCETGYDLYNCGTSNGGGSGYDTVMQGTGGGCSMGSTGEKVTISFS